MTIINFNDKQAFINALEARRPFWQAYDTRRTEEHKLAEEAWLNRVQEKLRTRLDWTYEQWRGKERYASTSLNLGEFPTCPVLWEARLDLILVNLGLTQSKTFRVDSKGGWGVAYQLLTFDPDAPTTVCE